MTNERTYQVIIGILVLIIIIGGLYAFRLRTSGSMDMTDNGLVATTSISTSTSGSMDDSMSSSNSMASSSGSTSSMSMPSDNTMTGTGDSVSVSNQAAGMSVTVDSVTVGQSSWVAIRDSSGRTLGAALFPAGTQTTVLVPLLRATTAGQSYQVLLYADNGDKQFDLHTDQLIINADGSVAGTTFIAN